MLVDLDYFFAQCEELRNPSLKDKPVVICVYSGRSQDSGAVSTANYIARTYGVRSGMPIYLARKKLENVDAAFLPVDDDFYEEISDKAMSIFRGYADEFEQVGIDEAYLDVTILAHGEFENAEEIAQAMKKELRSQQKLTCSIGIGPNKLVAKIAADQKKPDGMTVVTPDQVKDFLAPLPVDRLIGVGTKTAEKMRSLGIVKIDDITRRDVQELIDIFGRASGIYFHNAALGIDNEAVQKKGGAESISRIATLKQNTSDLAIIVEKTNQLCTELHGRIIEEKLTFKTVGIIFIATNMSVHTRSKTLENSSNDIGLMEKTVAELFKKFQDEIGLEARRVGVKLSNLHHMEKNQKQITSFLKPT
jgi:DNA polymerase IV (DinB-like DNA polymerase)